MKTKNLLLKSLLATVLFFSVQSQAGSENKTLLTHLQGRKTSLTILKNLPNKYRAENGDIYPGYTILKESILGRTVRLYLSDITKGDVIPAGTTLIMDDRNPNPNTSTTFEYRPDGGFLTTDDLFMAFDSTTSGYATIQVFGSSFRPANTMTVGDLEKALGNNFKFQILE